MINDRRANFDIENVSSKIKKSEIGIDGIEQRTYSNTTVVVE